MTAGTLGALSAAAATVGALHSLAPDHWVPFAAVARARGWSGARTARVTVLSGFGHVTVSVAIGLLVLFAGLEAMAAAGERLEALAPFLLIAFGLVYGLWGLRRAAGRHMHGHVHAHYDHVHEPSRRSAWTLFVLFSLDPCVAVIPFIVAAAPLGARAVLALVLAYEAATIGTMVALVASARAGARVVRAPWLDHYGDAVAGALIAATGVTVVVLGI